MPTYDYRCNACDHEFELFQSMSAGVKKKCPECGKLALERLIGTGSALIFKGSGFYETDYRSSSYKAGAKADKPLGEFKNSELQKLAEVLKDWIFHPSGTEGFAKAEVTIGGVSTDELSSKTMEARKVPGLYVIGEAVDVTGWLGGYNFQWAWASAVAAGDAI